jgi:recombinase, phage RecT family
MTANTALQTVTQPNGKGITALIEASAPRLTPLLPEGVTLERLAQIVYFESKKNPAILRCKPESIVSAVSRVLRSGLELGETCYLVPFGSDCTFIADYKGLAQLMIAGRAVRAVEMECVWEGDEFEVELGLNSKLRHVPRANKAKRGELRGAYVVLRLPGGMSSFKWMTAEDIDAIRLTYSKSWKNGKLDSIPWYACKTVLRQIAKTMPKSKQLAQFYAALAEDDAEEFGDALPDAEDVTATTRVSGPEQGRLAASDEPDDLLAEDDDDFTDAEVADLDDQRGLGIAEPAKRARSAQSHGR